MRLHVFGLTRAGWAEYFLALEALFVGYIAGFSLHRTFPEVHGALVLTLGIVTCIVFLVLIIKSATIFWLWTAGLAGGVGYNILHAARDIGWGLFWAILTALIIVSLHVYSRIIMTAEKEDVIIVD